QPVVTVLSRAAALAAGPRVAVQTPRLTGSISLAGARLDDLVLCGADSRLGDPTCYRQTVQKDSPPVELLTPFGAADAYFAVNGWLGSNIPGMPNETTPWTQTSQGPLTDNHPLELSYTAPSGLVFHREIKVDDQYLFTVTDQVTNQGATAVEIAPYGSVQRRGVPPDLGKISIEGAIGMFDRVLKEFRYPKWKKDGEDDFTTTGGWLGVTDKYWMTVFVPSQSEPLHVQFRVKPVGDVDTYETAYVGAPRVLAPGASTTETTHIFAGAKIMQVLQGYSKSLATPRLEDAIDWGIFSIINKPLFLFLEILKSQLGSFALALLALTVVIRVVFFPLYNLSYAMTTKMKKVQPQIKEMQERLKDDPQAVQKEMLALYQREKINPVSGCVPALLPIPVMIALVNLFNVTIEMRHAPFFGWIGDMSAADPTTVWNLFGLIPWNPGTLPLVGGLLVGDGFLHLGAWPLIYAFTLWISMSLAPPTPGMDPTQQKLMQWMPVVFTFFLAHSPAGLVIYWSWSSVFTIIQQYVLMRRFKVENPIDDFFARFGAAKASPG
ncbi:MAG TPA: membrane protein insertase YidC, partial [Caulobacteraceae bacterium]|nr:membrane protein insertase YidC [Caulobacteraceae bacterium]